MAGKGPSRQATGPRFAAYLASGGQGGRERTGGGKREGDLAALAAGQLEVRVRQFEAHAEGAARRVEHLIDHADLGLVGAADRLVEHDGGRHPKRDLLPAGDRQVGLDVERIELDQGEDRAVLAHEFARRHQPLGDDAADRAADHPQFELRLGALEFDAVELVLEDLGLKVAPADLVIGLDLIELLLGDDALRELVLAFEAALVEFDAGLLRLDAGGRFRLRPRQGDVGLLHARIEPGDDVAGLNRRAPVDRHALEDTERGRTDLQFLRRLHHAIDTRLLGARRAGGEEEGDERRADPSLPRSSQKGHRKTVLTRHGRQKPEYGPASGRNAAGRRACVRAAARCATARGAAGARRKHGRARGRAAP
ncbi:hypothetical protein DHODJN_03140 [Methylorubrum extorquens]